MAKKAKVKKTKVGSEYRVRDKKDGKLHGEFNKKDEAKKRASKVKAGYKSKK